MPRKSRYVAYDPNASLTKDGTVNVCSCGKRFTNKSNANKHVAIHNTRECPKRIRNNKCMKKWRHEDGDCHIGTESGYITFEGTDKDPKWGCNVLVLDTNEEDNTVELRECGHEVRTDAQFRYHNKSVHKFHVTNTTSAQLKQEIRKANEKLRAEFLSLTGTTGATTINTTNIAGTSNTSATNPPIASMTTSSNTTNAADAASITNTHSVSKNSNKKEDCNCNKSGNTKNNINCQDGDNNVCFG